MLIAGIKKTSLIDWPPNIVTTLFTKNCNFRCGWCHNPDLVKSESRIPELSHEYIDSVFNEKSSWIDGVCITGGEPLIQSGLEEFLAEFKKKELPVKLDTNGYSPRELNALIDKKLIQYVAMDIKAPLEKESYSFAAGIEIDIDRLIKSIDILREGRIDYEFRTTAVPGIIDEEAVEKIAEYLSGARLYVLKNFTGGDTLDKSFSRVSPYGKDKLRKMKEIAQNYIKKVELR